MRSIEGYKAKNFPGLRLVVRDDLAHFYSEQEWLDFCLRLFAKPPPGQLRKQTSTKEIFTLPFPLLQPEAISLVKKYKSKSLAKMTKDLWRGSRALQELQIARAIHDRGIVTAVPLLAAERMKRGLVYESLLVLPFLSDACELKDFFLEPQNSCRSACSPAQLSDIFHSFGRLTAMIFRAGINQNDYSLNNFLIRKETCGHRIYFIDFERAAISERITDRVKTELLAKLNRAGHEVRVGDRLRFLRGYLALDDRAHGSLLRYARELQKQTLSMIQRDLKRGRLTSIYTSGAYEKFRALSFRGMYKSGYRLEEIMDQLAALTREERQVAVTIGRKADTRSLIAVKMERGNAEKTWAVINALKLSGLPLEMPHIYAEGDKSGFLFLQLPASGGFPALEALARQAGAGTMKIIEEYFPDELRDILALYTRMSL
jgi:tRNA A-37 threonylcarbamoyl transferase component Bud32